MNTVKIHDSARQALKDAEARPLKSIFQNTKTRAYAVGDWDDLPIYKDARTVMPGFWKEITLRELTYAAMEEAKLASRPGMSQDAFCHGCLNAATCNVILKDEDSILEPCGDRIEAL